ncbi:MAG: transcription antitermination factor NusB [Anaerolineales bacterium]|jgi:N utilization substance protein B
MKDRTRARGIALQALYELDLTNHPVGTVLQERTDDAELEEDLIQFFRTIVLGVLPIRTELDRYIADHAPEWPLDQVAVIDRNILRMALWEFAVAEDIPLKVAINEAVELAKAYGSDSAPRFVNGVLGALANRQQEIKQALGEFSSSRENPPL